MDNKFGSVKCVKCGLVTFASAESCKGCGSVLAHHKLSGVHKGSSEEEIASKKMNKEGDKGSEKKLMLGLIGSLVLFIGVFTPIISLPIVGSVNYFQNGKGDGVIVLGLALISLVLTLLKKWRGLWYSGFLALGLMLFTFVNFQMRISDMKTEMETKLAGNPFRGLADVAMQSIQIQWGWAVMIVGAACVIAAAAIKAPQNITEM